MRSYLSLNPLAKAKFGTGSTVRALDDAATLIGGLDDTTPTWLGLTLSGKPQKNAVRRFNLYQLPTNTTILALDATFLFFLWLL